jgi:hypothetical protein
VKVSELIARLQKLDPDLEVVFDRGLMRTQISRIDAVGEGNVYHKPDRDDYTDQDKRGYEPVRVARLG